MSRKMVTVRFAEELVEQMSDWGPPVQCKIVQLENGEHELFARIVLPHMMIELSRPLTDEQVAEMRSAWDDRDWPRPILVADLPPAPPADSVVRG
jgi:hypothetical protein